MLLENSSTREILDYLSQHHKESISGFDQEFLRNLEDDARGLYRSILAVGRKYRNPSHHYHKLQLKHVNESEKFLTVALLYIDRNQLGPFQEKLLENLLEDKDLYSDQNLLLMALLESYGKFHLDPHGKANAEELLKLFSDEVLKNFGNDSCVDLSSLKELSERTVKSIHGTQDIAYNCSASHPLEPITRGKLQCYSGTCFSTIVEEFALKHGFCAPENRVFAFADGHIFKGTMDKDAQNNWTFNGVEYTSAGDGKYGKR